jgi:hypothetical protein
MRKSFICLLAAAAILSFLSACHTGKEKHPDLQGIVLQHSMKGWELYGWQEKGFVQFSLMIGTNRPKTVEEIVHYENKQIEGNWFRVRVQGLDNLEALLQKVPAGDYVTWCGAPDGYEPLSDEMLELVKIYCPNCGIE